MKRRRSVALLSLLLGSALGLGLVAGHGRAEVTFDVVNGSATASADHVSAGNDAFPNFANGAVDNRYPLAFARVDNLSSEGLGSPLDTGPIGQTGAAQAGVQQPQYADAKYPPKPETATVGAPPVAYATAHAAPDTASSQAAAASVAAVPAPTAASAPPEVAARLRRELERWRHTFLTADDRTRHPFLAAAGSDGVDGLASTTTAVLDRTSGVLRVEADARVARASFGGGAIAFAGIHVHVTITNDGVPRREVKIEIASASVGGVPVTVGADGVAVNGTQLPGVSGTLDQANAQLNAALRDAGFEVLALRPQVTGSGHMMSVDAAALIVRWQGGDVAPGVPRSFVSHTLGEAFAFSLAVATAPTPTVAATGNTSRLQAGPTTTFIPGTPGTPGTPPTAISGPPPSSGLAAAAPIRVRRTKPLWLLLLYLLWQSTVVGAAASLWWWRAEEPGS